MVKTTRELGPLQGSWDRVPIRDRVRWAAEGHSELSGRIAKRLSITKKDAKNILRIVGQESADMAHEGWIFSIPYLAIFWTYITRMQKSHLRGYEGQMLGGNQRLRMKESASLKKKIRKEKDSETNANTETKQDA